MALRTICIFSLCIVLGPVFRPATAQTTKQRPNIVLIMVDDMGFSDIGSYGGEIDTPNLDRLADQGLRFTQFYNTSKCFPSRASLLTGLYAHQVAMGDRPGTIRNGVTIAEVLREAGYRTLMTGKWHGVENPYDRGFDRYFGLVDGAVNHFNPGLQRPGEPPPASKAPGHRRKWAIDEQVYLPFTPSDPNFYSTDAYTDRAISFLEDYQDEARPFFLYLAYTAPHDPIQAWPEDVEKYRGTYMAGWDELRRRRYERQVESGLIDSPWELSERSTIRDHQKQTSKYTSRYWDDEGRILPWDEVEGKEDWDLKMAVYAAMVDRLDRQIGRLLSSIRAMGKEDDTLVLFLSDNGGSAEMVHNQQNRNHPPVDPPGPMNAWHSVDAPWANLSNTPFRYYKNWSHEGGIATPLIAYWPATISPGGITREVSHLIDIMATVVDVADADYPATYRGESIHPLEGKSLLPVLEGRERTGHEALYFEWNDGKAVRQQRWKLVDAPGEGTDWELYDMAADRTETSDLSGTHPEKVAELAELYGAWARRVGVGAAPQGQEAAEGPAAAIRLIVRGDDFGNSHAANSVMATAFEAEAISSASLLVPAPWFAETASIVRAHPDWSAGIHLTITAEWNTLRWGPVASEESVPSLVAPDGFFYNRGYRFDEPDPSCSNCARGPAEPEEVEREVRAQIEAARLQGLRIDYIDCHMGETCRPDLYPIMQALSEEYCIPIASGGFLGERRTGLADRFSKADYASYRHGVLDMIEGLEPGLWMYVTHPSAYTPELRAMNGDRLARVRVNDLNVWRDPAVKDALKKRGVELVGVRELWDYEACRLKE